MSRRTELALLLAAVAVAALLRLLWLDAYPPGWHHDEALMGVMASEVLEGAQRPIFFPGYAGQEPLYIYLSAGMMALMQSTDILPVRLTSALLGLITVVIAYLMGKEMFGRRVALLGAAVLATNFYQVMSSRNGYRSISQPVLEGLAVYFFWRGRRSQGIWWYVAAGAAAAGATYTYLGGRSFPAVLVAFGLWSLIFEGRPSRATLRRVGALIAAAVVVAAPIYLYWLRHPGTYSARMDQVFILNPAVNKGDPLFYITDSVTKALQLFTMQGEMMWRYNLPGHPIFVWALAPLFYLGLIVLVRHAWRRDAAAAMILLWMAAMLGPSVLSWDVGGYTLRAMSLVPALYLIPAVGMDRAWRWLDGRVTARQAIRIGAPAAIALILVADAGLTYRDYFVDWGEHYGAAYEGDAHVVAEARYLAAEAHPERDEVFAGSDYRGHPIIRQLAPKVYRQLRWFDGAQSIVYSPELSRDSHYVLSLTTLPPSVERYFPPETQVATERFARGIEPGTPGPAKFTAFRLTPAQVQAQVTRWIKDPATSPLKGNFGDTVEVLGAQVLQQARQGDPLPVFVIWRVLKAPGEQADLMFFSHLLDEQGTMWSQLDRNGYPTAEWRPGDVVVSRYDLTVPASLAPGKYLVDFGLYNRDGTNRLPLIGAPQAQTTLVLGGLKVAAAQPPTAAMVKNKLDRQVGDSVKLLGYNLDRDQGKDGRPDLEVTLLWQALAKPAEDYTVFLQLLGPDGKLAAQSDAMPAANRFPTGIWDAGDTILDQHHLKLDTGLPAGQYRLIAGMYLLRTGQRLPVSGGGDFVTLGDVNLPP